MTAYPRDAPSPPTPHDEKHGFAPVNDRTAIEDHLRRAKTVVIFDHQLSEVADVLDRTVLTVVATRFKVTGSLPG